MMLAGRMRSTNTFFCNTSSSPAGDRINWKIFRADSGQSFHVSGHTSASM